MYDLDLMTYHLLTIEIKERLALQLSSRTFAWQKSRVYQMSENENGKVKMRPDTDFAKALK